MARPDSLLGAASPRHRAKPATITVDTRAVHMYAAHTDANAELTRSSLVAVLAELSRPLYASTVRVRFSSLSLFLDWCVAEGELQENALQGRARAAWAARACRGRRFRRPTGGPWLRRRRSRWRTG